MKYRALSGCNIIRKSKSSLLLGENPTKFIVRERVGWAVDGRQAREENKEVKVSCRRGRILATWPNVLPNSWCNGHGKKFHKSKPLKDKNTFYIKVTCSNFLPLEQSNN